MRRGIKKHGTPRQAMKRCGAGFNIFATISAFRSNCGTNFLERRQRPELFLEDVGGSVLRQIGRILIVACLASFGPNEASAQVAVPVPGAAPSPPLSALPVDPAPDVSPANPPLSPPQLVDKSIHDLSKGELGKAAKDDIEALRRGPLLIHGNYCGIGNRPGTAPTDALDVACMRHDACTPTGGLPSCACDQRFRLEATAVVEDPATPPDLKVTAAAAAAAIAILVCPVSTSD